MNVYHHNDNVYRRNDNENQTGPQTQEASTSTGQGMPLTFGQKAVGLTFNPSNDPEVHEIKAKCAAVIDTLDDLRKIAGPSEKARMLSKAITDVQTAQMWGVKAVTWKD